MVRWSTRVQCLRRESLNEARRCNYSYGALECVQKNSLFVCVDGKFIVATFPVKGTPSRGSETGDFSAQKLRLQEKANKPSLKDTPTHLQTKIDYEVLQPLPKDIQCLRRQQLMWQHLAILLWTCFKSLFDSMLLWVWDIDKSTAPSSIPPPLINAPNRRHSHVRSYHSFYPIVVASYITVLVIRECTA